MDGIKQQQFQKQQDIADKRYAYEMRKVQKEYRNKLDALRIKNEDSTKTIKDQYEGQRGTEKIKLTKELTSIRRKNAGILKDEKSRYERMLSEMKMTHEDRVSELKIQHDRQIESEREDHKEFIDTARAKFEEQKVKYDA